MWSTLRAISNDKRGSAAFVVGGYLYVAGGERNSATVKRYDKATDTWTAVALMLEGRADFCAVTIGSADLAKDQDLFDSLTAKAAIDGESS
jgi:hypothetical protein